jgi:23S rRNA maturation mini-RNase III
MSKSYSKYLRTLFFDEKTTQGYRKTENHERKKKPKHYTPSIFQMDTGWESRSKTKAQNTKNQSYTEKKIE